MSKGFFQEKDIDVESIVEYIDFLYSGERQPTSRGWRASIHQRPYPEGPRVSMDEWGATAEEAVNNLRQTIESQGWELR